MDLNSWMAAWWAWAVATSLQASALLCLAWIADRLLVRKLWPQVLIVLWLVALTRFFLPPTLGSPISLTTAIGAPTLAASKLVPQASLVRLAFVCWLAGALLLVATRIVARLQLMRKLAQPAPPPAWNHTLAACAVALGLTRLPRIGSLANLQTAAVVGLLRPTLLVPHAWLERRPDKRCKHALLHELAHLKARDLWLDELCALVRAVLWFHPLVWIAARRLHALSELCCDQTVALLLGGESLAYRDTLILAARPLLAQTAPQAVRGFVSQPNTMVLRIERLEHLKVRPMALVRGVSASLLLSLAACILPMAPQLADLREQARRVFDAERRGEMQSCFTLQAAAMVLAAESTTPATGKP